MSLTLKHLLAHMVSYDQEVEVCFDRVGTVAGYADTMAEVLRDSAMEGDVLAFEASKNMLKVTVRLEKEDAD